MMENLLSTSSDLIDTASISSQSERTSPVNLPEFDGETVLCRVCGDRASGFHYGVHACEGCKGFFRRSIQQKIQYRPCLKNQQCNIQRVNRNRCQYCRLKKCISVGMSRDAVRFGRVPKKEKARIIEQMQKKNLASQTSELNSLLANDFDVVAAVVTSHRHTCDISQFRAHQMRDLALHNQEYVNCPANMACPLNNEIGMDANANSHNVSDFSESFTPAIKSVVDFAKGIPGFILLNQDDQVTLLKAGTFEVLLVRLACLFDPNSNTMMFTGGKLYKRQPNTMTTNAGFLLDSMFDFAERFNKMCLMDNEIALFSAVVLMSPDRPGLRNVEQVERIQNKLTEALQNIINTNHKEDGTLFAKLLMKTTDLRTLNTLHSEKSIAGQRASNERRERMTGEDNMDVDFQESISTRSGRSSPTLSETSNMTMTSGYSGDTDSSNIVVGQRLPLEASSHQQVVLRTPYGTFFREEMSGFYGMMADQPRRRCNTLDRDTLTRPRLHTIEEGNRRRYTLDRDYINKMVNRLNDRLETRGSVRGDSVPPSISNSATSSPIQEEGNSLYPPAHPPHSSGFTPITAPDGTPCTRTSPHISTEALMAARATGSSPGSPKSRSRSGSFTQDDYVNSRPRCYSFHLNSEGRAARMSLQHRMMAERGATGDDRDQISPEAGQYLTPEMRRGSVGAAYGLHSRKQSLLVDRPLSYINRPGLETDKRAATHGHPAMKHLLPDPALYGLQLNPELAAQRPALWHQQAALAMGMAPPMTMPMVQRPREEMARPVDSRAREWEAAKTLTRELPREVLQQDIARSSTMKKCPMTGAAVIPTATPASSTQGLPREEMAASTNPYMMRAAESSEVKQEREDRPAAAAGLLGPSALAPPSQSASPAALQANVPKVTLSSLEPEAPNSLSKPATDVINAGVRGTPDTADMAATFGGEMTSESKPGQDRGSPTQEDMSVETFGHKKFDRFRKDKGQAESSDAQKVKEERMDEDELKDGIFDSDKTESKSKVGEFKAEPRGPSSPASSHSSCPSPNGDRTKLSAKEAHPNLLAHLMNGGSSKSKSSASSSPSSSSPLSTSPQQHQTMAQRGALSAGASPAFPWSMASPSMVSPPGRPPVVAVQSGPSMSTDAVDFSSHHHSSSATAAASSSSSSSPAANSGPGLDSKVAANSKEEFHAAAVSHLKDKLLRKYDSMENLAKVGKEISMDTDVVQNGPVVTTPTTPASLNSGLTIPSSTADLNKELATKLTISPATNPSSTLTNSMAGEKSTPDRGEHMTAGPSSSSPQTSPRAQSSSSSSSSASLSAPASAIPSHFLPHPSAAMSQMLLSQGIMHHPMYHSMRHHYPNLMAASSAGSNPCPLPPHLANMQQFAQMISRTPAMQAGLEKPDKRMDFGSPLNLTSRMEDGSSSPSHSPQTPA